MNVHNEGKAREDRKISVRIESGLAKVSRALGPGKVGWIQETKVQTKGTICYLAMTVAFQDTSHFLFLCVLTTQLHCGTVMRILDLGLLCIC